MSAYSEKAAGIFLSRRNTNNEHRYSATFAGDVGSILIYNMSAGHEQQVCDTTDTNVTRVRHECYTNETSSIRVLKIIKRRAISF